MPLLLCHAWLSRRISRAARTTHQAHDSVYGNHSRSDVATGLQSFPHILGDKERLAVPDLKLCKAKQGALNRAVMTKETRVDCFWLPACGSDGTSVLLNSQMGPQNSKLLNFKLLEKLVKKDRRCQQVSAVLRQAATRPCCLRGGWDVVAGPGDSPLDLCSLRGGWPRDGTAPASRRQGAIQPGASHFERSAHLGFRFQFQMLQKHSRFPPPNSQ